MPKQNGLIGRTLSHYRITDYVGRGEMGEVYKAEHTRVGVPIAVKFIPESMMEDAKARERFERQAGALAALNHPNICGFYEINETPEGRPFIAMSFCGGDALQTCIARGRFSVPEALAIAYAIADGLAYAHRKHVIHRDLKPANLMFDADGVIKIVDFGLAKLTDRTQLTSSGHSLGTLMYMSPEQLNGDDIDGRVDVFALGNVLYEMLIGSPPFYAERRETVIYKIINEAHKPLREVRADVPESVARIVDRALAKAPDERYQTAADMRDDLYDALVEVDPEKRRKRPIDYRVEEWKRRLRRIARRAAPVAAVALVALAIWRWWPDDKAFGVAVFPAERNAGSHEEQALAAGLAQDLTDRIRIAARGDPSLWAVSPDRIKQAGVMTPDNVRGVLGARLAITLRTTASDHPAIQLKSFDVSSSATPSGGKQIDLTQLDAGSIDRSIRELIGVGSNAPPGGYTQSVAAYRDYLIGLGYLDAANLDSAATTLVRAASADSTFARAHAALGEYYRRRFAVTQDVAWAKLAEASCRAALALYNDQPFALVTLGQLFVTQNEPSQAIEAFEQALAIDPRCEDALWQLAGIHAAADRTNEAKAAYLLAIKSNPGDPSAYEWLGYFCYMHERYPEAIAQFSEVSRLIPEYGQTYNYLGACYFAIDCWEKALEMFTRSFSLGRTFAACANLGALHYMNHRFIDAAQMYEWTREYSPTNAEVVGYLATARYWIPGERDQAIALYREAVALAEKRRATSPNDGRRLALLAGYYSLTNPDSVASLAQQAVTATPDDSDVQYHVGVAFEVIGNHEKALIHLARAIDLGHSIRQIETEPFLDGLRGDGRYKILIEGAKSPSNNCSDL